MEENQEKYMQRCLQLAKLGEGHTAPNPMVGCVIVNDGKIIGEGFHQLCGGPHAEVNAIYSVKNERLLQYSTLYVNLEPCSYFGKTPPCTDLIIEKKISRVIIGSVDPNPEVAGRGIKKLIDAGCSVLEGVLLNECQKLNRRFFTFHLKKRPYIILKWAQTLNGFVDIVRTIEEHGKPVWITDEIARVAVHKQRSTEGAIFIGTETALKDNPSLTLRDWYGKQPLRIATDLNNRLPYYLNLFDGKVKTIILSNTIKQVKNNALNVEINNADTVKTLLDYLYSEKILSVVVEGGPKTLQYFIDQDLWDEAHVYKGNIVFNEGVKAPIFNLSHPIFLENFSHSELAVFRNQKD
jgi:diaminohydroxyphosphoribosylaminopyrimidine deaminase / 5-amino-6-(5-phosphoribosylamino)uracil reductase